MRFLLAFAFLFLLFTTLSFATNFPFDTKTQNGLTVGIQPAFMPTEKDGILTACFWAQLPTNITLAPTLSKTNFAFAKSENISNIKISLIQSKIRQVNYTEEIENCTNITYAYLRCTIDENGTETCEPAIKDKTFCEKINITATKDVWDYPSVSNSNEVLYCYDRVLQKDKENRIILPSSNPFNITITGMKADPDPGCQAQLGTAGETYTMTTSCYVNNTNAYNITAANITLDCAGFSIAGNNSTSTSGIYSTQVNSTIKNCNISNFSTGIYINGDAADYANITNNTINLTYATSCLSSDGMCNGIFINGADNLIIQNNYIRTYRWGINSYNSANNNRISYNNISSKSRSVWIESSINNTISYNNASASVDYAIRTQSSSNNNISYNNASAGTNDAIMVYDGYNNTVFYNYASVSSYIAIDVYNSYNTTVFYNNASALNNLYAIQLYASSNNTISYNNISALYNTIYIYSSSNNNINNNSILSSSTVLTNGAIYLTGSTSNNISNNTISALSTVGIYIVSSSHNTNIVNNTINGSGSTVSIGINLSGGDNISINCMGATITGANGSGSYGIYSTQFNTTIKNCIIGNYSTGIYINGDAADYANITNNTINLTYATSCSYTTGACNGIFLNNADYATIRNNYIQAAGGLGINLYNSASYNNVSYNNITASGTFGILSYLSSTYNNISYNNVSATSQTISFSTNANYNTISYNKVSTSGSYGLDCYVSSFNNYTYNNATALNYAIDLWLNCNNNNVSYNNIVATNDKAIYILTSANNLVANNSLTAGSAYEAINITIGSGNNTFLYNNISAKIWVGDLNGTNYYNNSNSGNIYYFPNGTGSWEVFDISCSGSAPCWADAGAARPFNASNVAGNWSGNGSDWFPWTENGGAAAHNAFINITNVSIYSSVGAYRDGWIALNITATTNETGTLTAYISIFKNGVNQTASANSTTISNNTAQMVFNLTSGMTKGDIWNYTVYVGDSTNISGINITQGITISNSAPTNVSIGSLVNATVGHWFTVNGSVDDADGGTDINYSNISLGNGTKAYLSNDTIGNTFRIKYNVSANFSGATTLNISFNDTNGANITTAYITNTFPDPNNATLANVSITPNPAYKSTALLTGTMGNFTDADGDVENTTSRTYRWFRNTSVISGQTGATLANTFFNKTDIIIFEETTYAQNWTGSKAITNSSSLTISNTAPTNVTIGTLVNASIGHSFTVNASCDDADGGTDINYSRINATNASCVYMSNDTVGNAFRIKYNCTGNYSTTVSLNITFNDTSNAQVITSNIINTYADPYNASLTAPSITPSPAYKTSTLTCNNGVFSDDDGDVGNATSIAYRWFKNNSVIAGQTAQTLAGQFGKSDVIICEENETAQNWTTSRALANSSSITISNTAPTNITINNLVNSSTDHSFLVNSSVDDADGAADINYSNTSNANGSCVYFSNDTVGNTFRIRYNCTATSESTTSLNVSFNDTSNANITSGNIVNTYPDHVATLGNPSITPNPAYKTSTLTCNTGSWSDLDGDTENETTRAWRWFRNTTLVPGQTDSTLANSYFNKSDVIICEETVHANDWGTFSYNISNSSSVTISNTAPVITADLSFINASAGHWFYMNATASDDDGAGDIINWIGANSTGSCTNFSNNATGNARTVVFNCSDTNLTGNFNITFKDVSSASVNTSTKANTYPNHAPSIAAPVISPSPTYYNSTLNCTNGTFTDVDGDIQGTNLWRWFKNTTLLAGETSQTLSPANFDVSDSIICEETPYDIYELNGSPKNSTPEVIQDIANVFSEYVNATNNTIYAPTGILVEGKRNNFLWNTITASTWVNSTSNTNTFNDSNSGNIYYFLNGTASWDVLDIATTNPPGWATSGTKRPFNAANTGGNWSGNSSDWFPWTENSIAPLYDILVSISNIATKVRFPLQNLSTGVNMTCVPPVNQTNDTGIYNVTNNQTFTIDVVANVNQTFPNYFVGLSNNSSCSNAQWMNESIATIRFSLVVDGQAYLWAFVNATTSLIIPPKQNITIQGQGE